MLSLVLSIGVAIWTGLGIRAVMHFVRNGIGGAPAATAA